MYRWIFVWGSPSNKSKRRIKYILAKPKYLGAFALQAKATAGHFIIWKGLGLHRSGANFVIREHKSIPWEPITSLQAVDSVETGDLFEQTVSLSDAGEFLRLRRVVLKLKKPTRNGENEIAILTMLPTPAVTAAVVTELYQGRRSVENLFQTVTENYECQIQTLGYPKAALFSFCLALVAYNILATVRGS